MALDYLNPVFLESLPEEELESALAAMWEFIKSNCEEQTHYREKYIALRQYFTDRVNIGRLE